MASSQKQVIARRFQEGWIPGYSPSRPNIVNGQLHLLDSTGKVIAIPLSELKMLSYVRELPPPATADPERLAKKAFLSRPRSAGLWVRLRLRDDDIFEGLAANDVGLMDHEGLLLTPPDPRSNTQRMYIPRLAIADMEVLAIIKSPLGRKPAASVRQSDLFAASGTVHRVL